MTTKVINSFRKIYYIFRPVMPRSIQILIRRMYIRPIKARSSSFWPIDTRAGKQPENWKGWPFKKRFAVVLTHDVDTAKGHENCSKLAELELRKSFRSSFNFVPERYSVDSELRNQLKEKGFEIGVHGLNHDGKLYNSKETFDERAQKINEYIHDWDALGFRSPSMHHNLNWLQGLDILYDASTFDTDPFEPQADGVSTIFPFWVRNGSKYSGFVELPYTLVQDWTLFVLMQEDNTDLWKKKIDWIAEQGGMVLLNSHPDYIQFNGDKSHIGQYPASYYEDILDYIKNKYDGQYWHALPCEVARFARRHMMESSPASNPLSYVLITAARNEEEHIARTIRSVLAQSTTPLKWVIVSDGSTDRTDEIIESYLEKSNFIELIKAPGDNRRNFGSKAKAVQAGYKSLSSLEYDCIGNLDADISFGSDFYKDILHTFEKNDCLGVSGGIRFDRFPDGFHKVKCRRNSVGGPFQMFRRECFEQIGGYLPLTYGGIDAVAESMARMNGWQVESFPHIKAYHYRTTGTAGSGLLKAKFRAGIRDYSIGYHPIFEMFRTCSALLQRPYLAGGLSWMSGYIWATFKKLPRSVPDEFVNYLRGEQMDRILPLHGLSNRKHCDKQMEVQHG